MSMQPAANLGLFSPLCKLLRREPALVCNPCSLLDAVYAGTVMLSAFAEFR